MMGQVSSDGAEMMPLKFDHAGISEQGHVRFRNEDFLLADVSDPAARRGALFVVADGVGGSGAGDAASREACRTLARAYAEDARPPERALPSALRRANQHVYDLGLRAGRFRMETTLSALALAGATAHLAHVGDSRIYRVRDGRAELLTRDHSEVAEMVKIGLLTPEGARHHPRRNVITQSVGGDLFVRPYTRREALQVGDVFVLCTDGLWEPVEDAEIAAIAAAETPEDACRRLIALGLERQTTDNLSVQIVRVLDVGAEDTAAPATPWWRRIFGPGGAR